jgi:hypothetical protein
MFDHDAVSTPRRRRVHAAALALIALSASASAAASAAPAASPTPAANPAPATRSAPAPAPAATGAGPASRSASASGPAPTAGASVSGSSTSASTTSSSRARPAASTSRVEAAGTRESATTLKGNQEGTVFKSLTVEGEDRVHVRIGRPELRLSLDPENAPGLSWGSAKDVLDRAGPDPLAPMLASTAADPCPYLARPWLDEFQSGPVASFSPSLDGVERWRMVVANSKGEAVTTFGGNGRPPKTITWDGRAQNGTPVSPGLTYSYVFEAYDRAGNKRNFVGPGFTVPAYRVETADGTTLLFAGERLGADFGRVRWGGSSSSRGVTPAILLEAASWLNQSARPTQPIRVSVKARSADEAQVMADGIVRALTPLVMGDPARIRAEVQPQPDAPAGGMVSIASTLK